MKTIKIKKLGIEVETETHDKGKLLEEIKIPKGWRLLKINEIIFLHNNLKYKKQLNMKDTWEYFEQPLNLNKQNNYISWFRANSGRAYFNCDWYPSNSDAGLGVRFVKNMKGGKKCI